MITLPSRFLRRVGFTLIELLVAIAVIGFLAVAVLAALNPVEQINKGRDTRERADAKQLLDGIERYYASSDPAAYPWNTAATGWTPVTPVTAAFNFTGSTGDWDWTNNLLTTGELKDTFVNRVRASQKHLVLKAAGSNATIYVCFYPTSSAFRAEADGYCQANGAALNSIRPGTCATTNGNPPATPGTNVICVP